MLRQVAVLLERENAKLHAKLHALAEELARLRGDTLPTPQHELAFLKELLAQRERALFGASSEQRPRREEHGAGAAARAAPGPRPDRPAPAADRGAGARARHRGPHLPAVRRDAAGDDGADGGQRGDHGRRAAVRARQAPAEEVPLRVQRVRGHGAGAAAAGGPARRARPSLRPGLRGGGGHRQVPRPSAAGAPGAADGPRRADDRLPDAVGPDRRAGHRAAADVRGRCGSTCWRRR